MYISDKIGEDMPRTLLNKSNIFIKQFYCSGISENAKCSAGVQSTPLQRFSLSHSPSRHENKQSAKYLAIKVY